MKYPGSKALPGLLQTIINNIPPHKTYIETHLGGGNILERKRPADRNIGVDLDGEVIATWRRVGMAGLELQHGDAVAFLRSFEFTAGEFVYADPPYVLGSRKGGAIYRHEYTDDDHRELLAVLADLPCAVMLSGYPSELYDASPVAGWRTVDCRVMTRGGVANERLWMNYPEPAALHELTFLGSTFRDRERIKRKKARLRNRLIKMDPLERAALLECLMDLEF